MVLIFQDANVRRHKGAGISHDGAGEDADGDDLLPFETVPEVAEDRTGHDQADQADRSEGQEFTPPDVEIAL